MRTARCPICRNAYERSDAHPFCSTRCRSIDLGDWVSEEYRVEARPPDDLDPSLIERILEGPDA